MAQVAIDDDADELLEDYVENFALGATKKAVTSEAIRRFVEDEA